MVLIIVPVCFQIPEPEAVDVDLPKEQAAGK
jgi:hypothetical protein